MSMVLGTYYVPGKATVFAEDKRSEHEHSAADSFRKDCRVVWMNETPSAPMDNGIFKVKTGADNQISRDCNLRGQEVSQPKLTFIFSCNC